MRPRRFKEADGSEAGDAELKKLFSAVPAVSDPSGERLARLRVQIDQKAGARPRRFRGPTVLGALLVAAAAAAAVGILSLGRHAPERSPTGMPQAGAIARPAVVAALPAAAFTAPPPAPTVAPPALVTMPARRGTHLAERRAGAPVAPAARPPAPVPTLAPPAIAAPPSEAVVLAKALGLLHRDGDPKRALVVLNDYFAKFPEGQLRPEARLAEIEALVATGRTDDVLQMLTPGAIELLPRSTELYVLRGELLARRHRCAEALVAFGKAAARLPADDALLDRVSRGRRFCHAAGER
ncbi:MAG TPA: hypothetical protein VMB50_20520 [Myxococcales bacterium]|nr:hypothetical protein [Myxococcales bacterium]